MKWVLPYKKAITVLLILGISMGYFVRSTRAEENLGGYEEVFKPYIVQGIMRERINTLEKGEKVEILSNDEKGHYLIKDQKGKEWHIPWRHIELVEGQEKLPAEATIEEIEGHVDKKKLKSDTPYLLWTDLKRQKTYVLRWDGSDWRVCKTLVCGTGDQAHPTPKGHFKIINKFAYIEIDDYLYKYASAFHKRYMYHSVRLDDEGREVEDICLGQPISFGGIYLSAEDSEWIYKHVPIGTTVWIN